MLNKFDQSVKNNLRAMGAEPSAFGNALDYLNQRFGLAETFSSGSFRNEFARCVAHLRNRGTQDTDFDGMGLERVTTDLFVAWGYFPETTAAQASQLNEDLLGKDADYITADEVFEMATSCSDHFVAAFLASFALIRAFREPYEGGARLLLSRCEKARPGAPAV